MKKRFLLCVPALCVFLMGSVYPETPARAEDSPSITVTHTREPAGNSATRNLLNINTASSGDLSKLPGLGPNLAESIVSYRQTKGPFKRTIDLLRVSGMNAMTFQKIRKRITVK